jgi:hypothetical protein
MNSHKETAAFRAHFHETRQTEQQYVKISHTEFHTNSKKEKNASSSKAWLPRFSKKVHQLFCGIIV